MADFSAKHYMIKSEKNAVRAGEEADRAKNYADSLQPETFVKTSGDQTISGNKTFSSGVFLEQGNNDKLFLKDTRVDVSSSTGTDTFNTIIFRDKNNFNYANIAVQDEADGGKRLRLWVQNKLTDGTTKSEQIWIDVEKNGSVVTYAPTPPSSDNSTQIATTSWVNTRLGGTKVTSTELGYLDGVTSAIQTQLNNKITATVSKAQNGYCKLSNGIIIQWGYTTSNNSTVTFPTAFTAVPSLTFGGFATGGSADYSIVYKSITATNFSVAWAGSAYTGTRWIAVGY